MKLFWILFGILAAAAVLILLLAFVCFRLVFYIPRKKQPQDKEYDLPPGKIYEPYYDAMITWVKETRALPHKDFRIQSFDGLTLWGKYYEYEPGAPIELMFHGYRGNAERDLCGGVQRCFLLGRNVLIVDQRGSGRSEGNVTTFGVCESRDCRAWIDCLIEHFGPDTQIILTGISMGAATVMITAGMDLPKNVICVLADCGYTSAPDIIKKVCRQIHLPAGLLYPVIRLGAKLYGGFDPEDASPLDAMKRCRIPAIFVHGESDDYVPCEMSRRIYEACPAPKTIFTVPGAGHGLVYVADHAGYLRTLTEFCTANGIPTEVK